jgi:hypothetical protein
LNSPLLRHEDLLLGRTQRTQWSSIKGIAAAAPASVIFDTRMLVSVR